MKQADFNYPLSVVLIGVLVLVTITGLIESVLDLNRFVWHKYSAYGFVALAVLHVYLSRKSLLAYFSRRARRVWQGLDRKFQRHLPLPRDFTQHGLTVEEAIQQRRSVRDYSGQPLTVAELSRLLHHVNGITAGGRYPFRAAPSSGGLYPIEIYPVVHNVAQLERGLYHYNVRDHGLELLRAGDLRRELTNFALDQEMVGRANLTLVLTAIFQRERWKYGPRAYRYTLLDAGHIGQNVYLVARSMDLGACAVGAFFDDDINQLLGIDGVNEAVIYLVVVGKTNSWRR
jgi:SagB-type dehydrogenase family enzyme